MQTVGNHFNLKSPLSTNVQLKNYQPLHYEKSIDSNKPRLLIAFLKVPHKDS